jgi:RNA polymerase sigma-54 factor
MALAQSLQQKLLQKLSPQQIQLMKLLQVPTANLEERIQEEINENPALELGDSDDAAYTEEAYDEFSSNDEPEFDSDTSADDYDNINISDYVSEGDDDIGDYRYKDDNYPEFDDKDALPVKSEVSFHSLLLEQLQMLDLDERTHTIAEQIVGSIDDDGYLRREVVSIVDDLAFRQNIESTPKEVENLIEQIQQFDPPGVAARDLRECLLIQLHKQMRSGKNVSKAIVVIDSYFDEFTKKHYAKIQKVLGVSDEQFKQIIQTIVKLNPKPGGYTSEGLGMDQTIIPDFFIVNNNGILELTLNARNAPELRISDGFKDMLREYEKGSKKDAKQKEAVTFIKQKIDGAKWFIDMIKQRQKTLLDTMQTIIDIQRQFFLTGDETTLKPMILKDIAAETGLDISTISRVANSKFVQTEFGTYKLKFFFSEGLSTDSGEEVSTREVKKILSDVISAEDKKRPLSDEFLTDVLREKGYNIARRTVAKYREQLNIPVARLRKEF